MLIYLHVFSNQRRIILIYFLALDSKSYSTVYYNWFILQYLLEHICANCFFISNRSCISYKAIYFRVFLIDDVATLIYSYYEFEIREIRGREQAIISSV